MLLLNGNEPANTTTIMNQRMIRNFNFTSPTYPLICHIKTEKLCVLVHNLVCTLDTMYRALGISVSPKIHIVMHPLIFYYIKRDCKGINNIFHLNKYLYCLSFYTEQHLGSYIITSRFYYYFVCYEFFFNT